MADSHSFQASAQSVSIVLGGNVLSYQRLDQRESANEALPGQAFSHVRPKMTQRAHTDFEVAQHTGSYARILPIGLVLTGLVMATLSGVLLLSAAQLGVFRHMMLGLIGVNFVEGVILSFVAIRIAVGGDGYATVGEKVVLLGMSLCTAIGLVVS